MSMFYNDGEYERLYAETVEELKKFGLTDQEAEIITRIKLAPRSDLIVADDLDLTVEQVREIYSQGAEKYLANGGKEYWQN